MPRFMPADGLWAFCMAVNVFLTFHTTKIDLDIRRFEKWYFFLCFGVSAIPALTYLFLDVFGGTDFYGDAVVWMVYKLGLRMLTTNSSGAGFRKTMTHFDYTRSTPQCGEFFVQAGDLMY
jgi:hypothetical protein